MDYLKAAKRLHKEVGMADVHTDLGCEIFSRRNMGERDILHTYYLESMREANLRLCVAAVYISPLFIPEQALKQALCQIEALYDDIRDPFYLVTSKSELLYAYNNNKIAVILSMEGLDPIGNELLLLSIFKRLGVRGAGLTWSRRNLISDCCGEEGGLSKYGKEVVKELCKLGMFIDVSHLSDKGFYDIFELTGENVIASHSNARSVHNIPRNLTDDMIKTIARHNGLIGINTHEFIAGGKYVDNKIALIGDHAEHIAGLVGINHIGLGLDLNDGLESCKISYGTEVCLQDMIKNYGEVINLTAELLSRGFTKSDVSKILWENFFNFFMRILP